MAEIVSQYGSLGIRQNSAVMEEIWNGHAFVFALNAAAPERFSEAREELLRMHNEISQEHPLLVLANKMDLHEAVDLLAVSQALERLSKSGRKIALKGVSAWPSWRAPSSCQLHVMLNSPNDFGRSAEGNS
ncbi:hypothetical protein B0H10DRAFT_1416747 [Mycena sp. CBHHK59/15]|nr:hypothetical protein B0H10DRAFT_1416747 [Mycena sp. CBHHK59/15]